MNKSIKVISFIGVDKNIQLTFTFHRQIKQGQKTTLSARVRK